MSLLSGGAIALSGTGAQRTQRTQRTDGAQHAARWPSVHARHTLIAWAWKRPNGVSSRPVGLCAEARAPDWLLTSGRDNCRLRQRNQVRLVAVHFCALTGW